MRRVRLVAVVAMLIAASLSGVPEAAAACASGGALFEPADGKTLLIIGQDRDSMDAYVAGTGQTPGGWMSYNNVVAPAYGTQVPGTIFGTAWHHTQHSVDTYPNTALQIGFYMVDQLDNINLGIHDGNIQQFADWIKSTNRPVFLRIGYEFDGAHNHYEPIPFVRAWRRVANLMRARGANNVAFVWHSYAAGPYNGHPISSWYPGDEYVDWAGVSLFGQSYTPGGMTYANALADFADAHNKPIMIAESTPFGAHTPVDNATALWNAWYVPTINFITTRNVKAWSYINTNWDADPMWNGQGWGDTRIEANPALESLWLTETGQAKYLKQSASLFCELGYPSTASYTATDEMNDFSWTFVRSPGLATDNYDPTLYNNDPFRAKRVAATSEFIVWKTPGVKSIGATAFIYQFDTFADFTFSTSADGIAYTPLSVSSNNLGGVWARVLYSSGAVPANTTYVRVDFPNVTTNAWTPQLGDISFKFLP